MNEEQGTRNEERRGGDDRFLVPRSSFLVLLFLVPRVTLLFVRQPFFDEIFTHWIAAKPLRGIIDALRFDSGPPLYYFVVHAIGNPGVIWTRALSLLFAAAGLIALLAGERLGEARYWAAALIAVFPPAVLFSVDARAYALCAMCVTFGVIALMTDRPWVAAAALLLAAYCHYYGALFLPLLLPRWRAFAAAVVLFLPGAWLAMHQPPGAREWMAFAWPDALFTRPPLLLAVACGALLVACAATAASAVGGRSGRRYTLMTLVPLALALALGVYVPMRFESVVAAPLALWLASSGRRVFLIPLIAAFALWTTLGIFEHAQRPPDDYRAAATWLAQNVPAGETVVASGYLYLETVAQRPAIAFPPEQAQHPGWRAQARSGSGLPAGAFLWIGERAAPELQLIRRTRRVTPIYMSSRAAVVKVN